MAGSAWPVSHGLQRTHARGGCGRQNRRGRQGGGGGPPGKMAAADGARAHPTTADSRPPIRALPPTPSSPSFAPRLPPRPVAGPGMPSVPCQTKSSLPISVPPTSAMARSHRRVGGDVDGQLMSLALWRGAPSRIRIDPEAESSCLVAVAIFGASHSTVATASAAWPCFSSDRLQSNR